MSEPAFERWGFNLPVGFRIKGREMRSFEIGPLRGRLRRELVNVSGRPAPYEHLAALQHVVTDLGGMGPPSKSDLLRLTLADMEYIFYCVACRSALLLS